jgi:hypothetical protein
VTQRVEATQRGSNFAGICWILMRLDENPVPRNTRRPNDHLVQSSMGQEILVGDFSSAAVVTK